MSKCRSCGAEIIWIKMRSGKAMPCDATPVNYTPDPDGELLVVDKNGNTVRGTRGGDESGYVSHFATCPQAGMFRRKSLQPAR